MAENKKVVNILLALPLVAGAIILYFTMRKKGSNKEDAATPEIGSSGNSPVTLSVFPLKRGSKGSKVKELQNALLSAYPTILPKYGADSDYGSETEAAVLKVTGKKTVDSQAEIDKIKAYQADRVYSKAELSARSKALAGAFSNGRKVQTLQATQVVTGAYNPYNGSYGNGSYVNRPSGYTVSPTMLKEDAGTGYVYVIDFLNTYQRVNPFHIKIV